MGLKLPQPSQRARARSENLVGWGWGALREVYLLYKVGVAKVLRGAAVFREMQHAAHSALISKSGQRDGPNLAVVLTNSFAEKILFDCVKPFSHAVGSRS